MLNLAEYRSKPDRLADYLPWAALIAPGIVLNKDGSFQRVIAYRGPDLESATEAELVAVSARINNVLRRFGSGWSLFFEATRVPSAPYHESRFTDANQAAKIEPSKDGYINAIQNYPFVKGALYQLYAAVNQVSDIALEPGERLVSVSAGDTVRWVVGDTTSGTGTAEQVHILVKPIASDLQTNLVINTDRRTYHLEMRSTEDTYMASVSWIYPYSDLVALQKKNEAAVQTAQLTIDQGLKLDDLKFRYRIEGDAPWKPLRAFDDGRKVYLQFPSGLRQGDAPPLFITGSNGEPALVNYRVKDNYYIVDRLFAAAELRFGSDPQQVVRITRTDATYRTVKASTKNLWGIRHDR